MKKSKYEQLYKAGLISKKQYEMLMGNTIARGSEASKQKNTI